MPKYSPDFDQNKNINARVYEALASGCLLFSDRNITMQKIFKKINMLYIIILAVTYKKNKIL